MNLYIFTDQKDVFIDQKTQILNAGKEEEGNTVSFITKCRILVYTTKE